MACHFAIFDLMSILTLNYEYNNAKSYWQQSKYHDVVRIFASAVMSMQRVVSINAEKIEKFYNQSSTIIVNKVLNFILSGVELDDSSSIRMNNNTNNNSNNNNTNDIKLLTEITKPGFFYRRDIKNTKDKYRLSLPIPMTQKFLHSILPDMPDDLHRIQGEFIEKYNLTNLKTQRMTYN